MSKALLLFAKTSVEKGKADPEKLARLLAAEAKSLEIKWAFFDDLLFDITNEHIAIYDTRNDCLVSDYQVVYFRYWGEQQGHALAVARFCKLQNIPYVDSETLRTGSQSKITQYVNLHEAGVRIPKTLIGSIELLAQNYKQHGYDFPFIMKAVGATRGYDNYLVTDPTMLNKLLTQYPETAFVLQSYIANDGDYRVLVFGDEVRMVIERKAVAGSHLNNTSQGGSATIVPVDTLPADVLKDCVTAAQFFGREIAGVDMIRSSHDGKFYCLEVNRAPQIETASFEQPKAALLAEYLESLSSRR